MLYFLCAVLLTALLLLLIALVRTLLAPVRSPAYAPQEEPERALAYAEILARLVGHETVSVSGNVDPDKFRVFHAVLRKEFPLTFAACEFHDINGGLLMRWPGRSSDHPVCFLAHMDVVEANADNWSVPPFSGVIKDGRVYGRGAMDDKCCLMAGFQAVEECIREGIVPDQDIYLASSDCEETGGPTAREIAAWLQDHGIRLSLLCDEGGGITEEPIAGLKGLYGMAGIYEKDSATWSSPPGPKAATRARPRRTRRSHGWLPSSATSRIIRPLSAGSPRSSARCSERWLLIAVSPSVSR